jgi:hypothetical protein
MEGPLYHERTLVATFDQASDARFSRVPVF